MTQQLLGRRPVRTRFRRSSRPAERSRFAAWAPDAVAVAVWGMLIAASFVIGRHLLSYPEPDIGLDAAPLYGHFGLRVTAAIAIPVAVAIAVIVSARVWSRVSWRAVLAVAAGASLVWMCALALTGGWSALAGPLAGSRDYLRAVGSVTDPGEFLSHFTTRLGDYPVHVQSHPPGMVLLLWVLERAGLGGAAPAAGLVLLAAASIAPAALVAVRSVAGEAAARRAAPFLVLTPAAVWMATSEDALFAAVSAWGIALLAVAAQRPGRASDLPAAAAGLVLGAALFFSYGVATLVVPAAAVVVVRRRVRPLIVAAVGVGLVAASFAAGGFWWLDGLHATIARYELGISRYRPYSYFLLANPAAFAIALGPAAAAGLIRLRGRVWALTGGAVAAAALALLSGYSKGEVERIWLPFTPWLLIAGAALVPAGPERRGLFRLRGWLAAQALWALSLQIGVRTPW